MAKDNRVRNWMFIVYPESAPENWRCLLDDLHFQWVESPLHDKDIDEDVPGGCTLKKAHWHILCFFEGKKSYEQIRDITLFVNAAPPKPIVDARSMVRYLIHLDDPDKYQYNYADIKSHGGYDHSRHFQPSSEERYAIIGEMLDFILNNHVTEYIDILSYSFTHKYDTWYKVLCDSGTYVIEKAVKSNRHKPQSNS